MKKYKAVISAVLIACACSDNPVGPEPVKSPREMKWKKTVITYEGSTQVLMSDIWASSPDNVYVCGHNDLVDGQIFRYNGESWSEVKIINAINDSYRINAVDGNNANDIYLAGAIIDLVNTDTTYYLDYTALIVNYNGVNWVKEDIPVSKERLLCVYALSPNEVYAGGYGGMLYSYNGSQWSLDTINIPVNENHEVSTQIRRISSHNNIPYFLGFKHNNTTGYNTHYFYSYENRKAVLIDSTGILFDTQEKFGTSSLYNYKNNLYSYGRELFKYSGTGWNAETITPYEYVGLSISSENNWLAAGQNNKVYHYDGSTWAELEEIIYPDGDSWIRDIWHNEKEAFVVGYEISAFPQSTIIWHGK